MMQVRPVMTHFPGVDTRTSVLAVRRSVGPARRLIPGVSPPQPAAAPRRTPRTGTRVPGSQ